MDLPGLQAQRKNLVQSMFDEGMLDGQFAQIQALQDASSPKFVTEVIIIFCNDAERIILELNKYMDQQDVDYSQLNGFVYQLKGSSSSIGARHVKLACIDLHQASDDKNKEGTESGRSEMGMDL
ncbi:histidine-containing phosphotransfer protein 1-like [Fagus crenata]